MHVSLNMRVLLFATFFVLCTTMNSASRLRSVLNRSGKVAKPRLTVPIEVARGRDGSIKAEVGRLQEVRKMDHQGAQACCHLARDNEHKEKWKNGGYIVIKTVDPRRKGPAKEGPLKYLKEERFFLKQLEESEFYVTWPKTSDTITDGEGDPVVLTDYIGDDLAQILNPKETEGKMERKFIYDMPDQQKQDELLGKALRTYLPQVLIGMHKIHQQGYLHRDLKLENTAISNQERAIIFDYGVMARLDDLHRTTFSGTFVNMPPEAQSVLEFQERQRKRFCFWNQLGGFPPDHIAMSEQATMSNFKHPQSWDIWSFGCMICSSFGGQEHVQKINFSEDLFKKFVREKFPDTNLTFLQEGTGLNGLSAALGRMFASNPADRSTDLFSDWIDNPVKSERNAKQLSILPKITHKNSFHGTNPELHRPISSMGIREGMARSIGDIHK